MEEKRPNPEVILNEIKYEENQKRRGNLKIFFGYSAGVGKTYAMLEEAHQLYQAQVDVVIGYIEPHQRLATIEMMKGLPQIPPIPIAYQSATLYEFDIDSALKRKPSVILVDELAHTNAKGCRHTKRYQDIQELLRMGIDVYTTVNVQHIEGLHDVIESITGIPVRERVPDEVFDSADKVEIVDIEPEDLIHRLEDGKVYHSSQAKLALSNFFTSENLVALREIALRRTADRVNISVEKNKAATNNSEYVTDEHILMCLSSSPSNAKVIRTAAKMAEAFKGKFTALFAETTDFNEMSDENKNRLREHIRLAEQLGAKIATVYGDDVAYQVAEYAKVSGVSKIVIGRPVRKFMLGFSTPTYVDKLTSYAPNLEVYVIPNKMTQTFSASQKHTLDIHIPVFNIQDSIISLGIIFLATLIGYVFFTIGFSESTIVTVYILSTLFIAAITHGKVYGIISSLCSVLLMNYFFIEPRFTFNVYDKGYPITFFIIFLSSIIISTITKRIKEQARLSSLKAYRTEILLETSQKLQQAKTKDEIFYETVQQIKKLLNREVFIYPIKHDHQLDEVIAKDKTILAPYLTLDEYAVAQWVCINNKHAGATTNTLSGAKCLYMAIREGNVVHAVLAITMDKDKRIDSFDKSLLIAILSECAMAIEKEVLRSTKNEAELKANREQLRANLLRAISHDLRTPLTGIVGGSGLLLENLNSFDKETLYSMLSDIYGDAQWLLTLVENLLNITKIQDGHLVVEKKKELVDEIVEQAVTKVTRFKPKQYIEIEKPKTLLFVSMDAQLIIQVIINLLDNAFKHTRENSSVKLAYGIENVQFFLTVQDNGGGIQENQLNKIFDLFFTTSTFHTDKQRGMGLGLSICKSIMEAHEGTIQAENNNLGGATFKITLPL